MTLLDYEATADLALRIVSEIQPFTAQIEIAGSIRRRRPKVRDIDLVLIPKTLFGYPANVLRNLKHGFVGFSVLRSGPMITSLTVEFVPVQIYRSYPDAWGIQLLRWTGSKEHNIMLARRAKTLGMSLRVGTGLFDNDTGEHVAGETERGIFEALKMDYVNPEDREI